MVAGFKSCFVHTDEKAYFDLISRSEQVMVENVNNFIKKCGTVTKESKTMHAHHLVVALHIVNVPPIK